ncbi:MAG: TIGR02757 family protein [Cyclobacteriaceae bacterium]|nr:TIGR02757 family protein [Cyclobacteriaceae bacterium]
MNNHLFDLLEKKFNQFNRVDFIEDDPIQIPHRFTKKQDIEIAGFFAAILAWGQRKTIINKCSELLHFMDDDPHQFILHHSENDLKVFENFKHRTFNSTDALYFIHFLNWFYSKYHSLEEGFVTGMDKNDDTIENGIIHFQSLFFSLEFAPQRTRKHIATPARKSACKRLNMYLRWMVRKDDKGVDFGIWNAIKPHQLVCPLDVHVERVAKKINLLKRKPTDWRAAIELTNALKLYDPIDPVKYDFALFGMGVEGFVIE